MSVELPESLVGRAVSIVVPSRNAAPRTLETVDKLRALPAVEASALEIIVVDDGSEDAHADVLRQAANARFTLVRNPRGLGRGGAINAGVAASNGSLLLILDCDCPPADEHLLEAHLRVIDAGFDASIGGIRGRDDGFWSRYQEQADERRRRAAEEGCPYSLTSANLMIRREAFESVGGFDPGYSRYGFEDRDLFIRLDQQGARLAVTPDARVIHDDAGVGLASVALKMREAGATTAQRFRQEHPEAYRALGYRSIDARFHPARALLLSLPSILAGLAPGAIEWFLGRAFVPFGLRAFTARLIAASAFARGTRQSLPN